jgi:hypothetical protein
MNKALAAAVCALALLGACATKTDAPRADAKPVAQATAPNEPALWVARDGDSTLYLYGTIHVRKAGAAWGGPLAEKALNEAQEVWTEVEIDPAKDQAMGPLVQQLGFDATRPLSQRLPPPRLAQLQAAATALNIPVQALDPMRPWFAGLTLSLVPILQAGYDPQSGVDRAIDRLAEASGKKMRWFETSEQQLGFLAGLSEPVQLQMLYEALDEYGEGPAMVKEMEAAWEKGDAEGLDRLVVGEIAATYPELHDVLFVRRNEAWTQTLMAELQGAGVDFVAVGAGHLVGKDSVVEMLRKRGVKVERVTGATR